MDTVIYFAFIMFVIILLFVCSNVFLLNRFKKNLRCYFPKLTLLLTSFFNSISFAVYIIFILGVIIPGNNGVKGAIVAVMAFMLFQVLTILKIFLFNLLLSKKLKAGDAIGVAIWGLFALILVVAPVSFLVHDYIIKLVTVLSNKLQGSDEGAWGWVIFPVIGILPFLIVINYYFVSKFVKLRR